VNDNWRKVREIFDAAICREPEERQKFIVEACGENKSLLARIESLLESFDKTDDFLETPIAAQAAGIMNSVAPPLTPGTHFTHYEVIEQIGAGGMGEVYLVKDKKLDRLVAVKILNNKFARHESDLRRFIKEAKAASALDHPNILVVHEFGESGGRHFIVSEYIKGVTLREFLKKDSIWLSEIFDIAIQIAGALVAAHQARLVHRDIKPENIIVRPDGFVKILDFGLVKLVKGDNDSFLNANNSTVGQTAQGVILGTVNYMSPEQAKGEQVDERTDIFSLGAVIYEMLTSKTPFAGDSNSETFANLINREPLPLSYFVENISEQIAPVVLKMLAKNKDERYISMHDTLADLKRLKNDLPQAEKLEPITRRIGATSKILQGTANSTAHRKTGKIANGFWVKIKTHKLIAATILLLLIFGAVESEYYFSSTRQPDSGERRSITVLPFKPISQAKGDDLYEIGIADSLIQRLSSIKSFVVRPLSAVRKYVDPELDPLTAGREQQTDYVLASSYQIANGRIRVTSELFNVASGQSEETYKTEKDAGDIFAMQDAVAVEIGNLLQSRFNFKQNNPSKNRGTENEDAYRLYLQGVYFNDKRFPQDGEKAVNFFEQAVQIDPNYARAWAGVAFAHRSLIDIGAKVDVDREYRISADAVNKALTLDPNLSEAYSVLCINKLNYEYDVTGAETACKRAIELDPNSPIAHNTFARLLFSSQRKRFDEAIAEIKTAIDLDPTSSYHQIVYMFALIYARRYDEAIQQLERLAERDPQRALAYFWLVGGIAFQGKQAEDFKRLTRFEKLAGIDEESGKKYSLAFQTDGWHGVLREQAERSRGVSQSFYFAACLYAQLGDKDRAIEYLEKTFQRHEHWITYLEVDPRFDSLRDDQRFRDLIRRVSMLQ